MKKIISIILVLCLSISMVVVGGIMAKGDDNTTGQYLYIKNDVDAARAMSLAFPNFTIPSNATKITMKVKSSSANSIANGFSIRTDDKAVVSTNQVTYALNFTTQWNTISIDISGIDNSKFKSYVFRLLDSKNDYYFDELKFVDESGADISVIDDYESYAVGSAIPLAGNAWTGINRVMSDSQGATTVPVVTTTSSSIVVTNKYMHIKSDATAARAMSFSIPNSTIPSAATAITMKVKAAFAETIATGLSIRKYTNGTGTDGQINKALTFTTEWNTIIIDITDVSKTDYHSYAIRLMDNTNDYYFDDLQFVDANGSFVSTIDNYESYAVGSKVPIGGGEWTGTNEVLGETQEVVPTQSTTTTTTTTVAPTAPTQGTTNKYLHIKNDATSARAMSLALPNHAIPTNAATITMKVKSSANHTISNGLSLRSDNQGLISSGQINYPIAFTTSWSTVSMDISSVSHTTYKSYVIRLLDNANDYYFDDIQFEDAQGNYVSTIDNYENYETGSAISVAGGEWTGTNEVLEESLTAQFDVSVDGVTTKYDEGAEFTFEGKNAVIGYTDGENYYAAGDKITVNSAKTFTSVKLEMSKGAAMRFNAPTGIRFCMPIDDTAKACLDALSKNHTIAKGTLISTIEKLNGADLTFALADEYYLDCQFTSDTLYTKDAFTGVVGSVVNIKDTNINKDFVGRGYVKIDDTYVYANYSESTIANNSRSICYIANCIASAKGQEGNEYDTLSEANQKIVDDYAAKYVG